MMKNFFLRPICCLFFAVTIWFEFASCCQDKNHPDHISDYGKSWITYAGTSVDFKNDSGGIASGEYSSPVAQTVEGSHGEECGDFCYIDFIKFSLTNPIISFSLSAANRCYGNELLDIRYENQTVYYFTFNYDTIHSPYPIAFHDSLLINGKNFQKVYESDSIQGNPSLLRKCYLTKDKGVVGYETTDGKIWSLQ